MYELIWQVNNYNKFFQFLKLFHLKSILLPGLGLAAAPPSARPSPVLWAAVFFLRPNPAVGFATEFLVVFIELDPVPTPLRGLSFSDFRLLSGVVVFYFSGDPFKPGVEASSAGVATRRLSSYGALALVAISVLLTPPFAREPVFFTPINADLSLLENYSPFLGLTPPSLDL